MNREMMDLCAWVVEQAKKAGARECRVGLSRSRSVDVGYRERKPETIKDATNQITFAYGPLNADVSDPTPTYDYSVGIENIDGTAGKSYFSYGGVGAPQGTPPVTATDLNVVNIINSASMTFKANVNLSVTDLPVVSNVVSEVSNFNAVENKAAAYTTVKYRTFVPSVLAP